MEAIEIGTSSLVEALASTTVTNGGSSEEGRKRNRGNREDTVVLPAGTVTHAHPAIFPKLMFLGLTEQTFSEGRRPSDILFDVFERGLQQRMAASGAPLELLRISDCKISAEYVDALQKLVECFDWDGSEGLVIDDGDDDGCSCEGCDSDEYSDGWWM